MLNRRLSKIVVFASALLLITACAHHTGGHHISQNISQLEINNLSHPEHNVYASGQPTKAQFDALAKSGIKHVINLRPAAELDWNEAEYVEALGMAYHSIPVAGAADVTVENATKLAKLLGETGIDKTLVHCSSSNRVGALVALSENVINGKTAEESITKGKRWGLLSLEPTVRERISDRQ